MDHCALHSFPTRRSSDLRAFAVRPNAAGESETARSTKIPRHLPDRKSTRLNSSHVETSYAVFCLKKTQLFLAEPPARRNLPLVSLDMHQKELYESYDLTVLAANPMRFT